MTYSNFVYDALPYIYTGSGTLTLLLTGETIGTISGLLLISAAMLVFHMRIEYRTLRAQASETRQIAEDAALALLMPAPVTTRSRR